MAKPVDLVLRLRAETEGLDESLTQSRHQLDLTNKATAELAESLTDVERTELDIIVNDRAINAAKGDIERLQHELRAQVQLGVDSSKTLREISKVERAIKALEKENVQLKATVDVTEVEHSLQGAAHKGGESFGEFKDEAKQNISEVASSFTGDFQSAVDVVQGTLGGIVGSLGPIGAALGALGAAGVGALAAQFQAMADKVNEARTAAADLGVELFKAGGNLDVQSQIDQMADWSKEIDDNRSAWELWQDKAVTNLDLVQDGAAKTGESLETMMKVMTGHGTAAESQRVVATLTKQIQDLQRITDEKPLGLGQFDRGTHEEIEARQKLIEKIAEQNGITGDGAKDAKVLAEALAGLVDQQKAAEQATADNNAAVANFDAVMAEATAATQEHQAALEGLSSTIDGFADPLAAYNQLLADKQKAEQESAQKTAQSTKDSKDSWQDYAKDVTVSVDEYLAQLTRQVVAQEQWATNLKTLAKRGVSEGVIAELAKLGPQGAPLIQQLTTASDAKLREMVSLFDRQGKAAGDKVAAGIRAAEPAVNAATQALMTNVNATIQATKIQEVLVPISADPAHFYQVLNSARKQAAEALVIP